MNISLSELDKKRFGVVTAKISFEGDESLADVLTWCAEKKVEFLIARSPTANIHLAQDMEKKGFILTDTLVCYVNAAIKVTARPLPAGFEWRMGGAGDAEVADRLAAQIFKGYGGHYHADARLEQADCDLVYSSWMASSCTDKNLADAVFFVTHESMPVGFLTVKKKNDSSGDIVLNGIHPDFQNRGLYFYLVNLAKQWAIDQNLAQLTVSTQVTNTGVQRIWCRQGFEPSGSFYTFHKWFNQ